MMEQDMIHGHDVLAMMQHNAYSHNQLLQAMISHFGPDARYCTCRASNMTAPQLIQFLLERGRIVSTEQGLVADADHICDNH